MLCKIPHNSIPKTMLYRTQITQGQFILWQIGKQINICQLDTTETSTIQQYVKLECFSRLIGVQKKTWDQNQPKTQIISQMFGSILTRNCSCFVCSLVSLFKTGWAGWVHMQITCSSVYNTQASGFIFILWPLLCTPETTASFCSSIFAHSLESVEMHYAVSVFSQFQSHSFWPIGTWQINVS